MSDNLKPCPFCGGDKSIICRTDYDGGDAYAVSCRYSDCHGHIFTLGHGYFSTKEEAIAAWNTRADADRIEQLERERDEWKSRYEHHNHERLETLNLNAMQASKIGSLMNKIATLEKEIRDLRGKE